MSAQTCLELPGGVLTSNGLQQHVYLHPLTGQLELQLAEMADSNITPATVTNVITTCLSSIGHVTQVRKKDVEDMCVADRQYLMLNLNQWLGNDYTWLHPYCDSCDAQYDIGFQHSRLPMKKAGESFPYATVDVKGVTITLRAPTGADQMALYNLQDEPTDKMVFTRCVVRTDSPGATPGFLETLSADDVAKCERQLEAVVPEVATEIKTHCPECGANQTVEIDPYVIPGLSIEGIFQDVHTIAFHYNWNEHDILSLPRNRRLFYLRLIDIDKGTGGYA